MAQDHERGSANWQAEWSLVPDALSHALAGLERMVELSMDLEVLPDRMRENLKLTNNLVYAEAVMMALAPHVGRQKAHDLVEVAVEVTHRGSSFVDALQRSKEISDIMEPTDIQKIFEGQAHIDAAERNVTSILDVVHNRNEN